MRTKGRVEEEISKLTLTSLAIFRPGLLIGREHDSRLGEVILSKIPLIPKISSSNAGRAMLEHSVKSVREQARGRVLLSHSDMIKGFQLGERDF